jgi:hypothetical protein
MRALAMAMVMALGAGCAAPRTAIVAGAGTMVIGGLVLSHASSSDMGPAAPYQDPDTTNSNELAAGAVGALLVAGGIALVVAGIAQLEHDEAHKM